MTTVEEAARIETRENIPLQNPTKSRNKLLNCLSCNEDYLSGSKFINVSFGTLTVIITVALLLQIYYGDYQVVPHGSVATDSLECSKIGTEVLKKGGNSMDATIASALCLAVVTPHLTSLDGEGQVLIYNHRKRLIPDVIDFSSNNADDAENSRVPRLVAGLAFIHQQYGSLPWKQLVQPSANLAREGFLIPKMLVQAIKAARVEDIYGRLEPGQILPLETLSYTLQEIADIPEQELYKYISSGFQQPIFSQALKFTFRENNVYVPNSPSAGPLFLTVLQKLQKHRFNKSDSEKTEYFYRVAEETQQFLVGEENAKSFHQGVSSNIAVMDLDDNYVSFTTGLYALFGSGEMTTRGYTFDVKSKNATCSRLPIIVTDTGAVCGRRFVFGANDVSTAVQLTMALLVAQESASDSVEAPRFHITRNGSVGIEGSHTPLFNEDVLQYLETLTPTQFLVPEPYMSSNIVEKDRDNLNSHSDSRGGGIASRF